MRKSGFFLSAALIVAPAVHAQDAEDTEEAAAESTEASEPTEEAEEEKKDEEKTLEKFVEEFEKSEGLFPLYRDTETGDVFIEIDTAQLGKEFIYLTYTENGPVNLGHFRGSFRDNRIVTFNRKFKRIEIEAVNTGFYFDPDNALSRAADANISRAPLGNVEIKAESEDGTRLLISADTLLEGEALHQIAPSPIPNTPPGSRFTLGQLSGDKTQITLARSYPDNTDIRVEYVFDNPKPINRGNESITDARSVAVLMQHTFLELPDDGFKPRADDYRVGFFTNQATDLTSTSFTPYRDVINRWRLEKKNPGRAISDPVKPITFWIENTTPKDLRGTIRDAALAWNSAFRKAGFSNAIEVKVQPDDADWDAGDLRYNVLRWTSSPTPPFGGYGPSFTNPRTGEIIGADIMLEYVFLTNRLQQTEIFETAALPFANTDREHNHAPGQHSLRPDCDFGNQLQARMMTARAVLTAQGASPDVYGSLVEQELYYLVLHEIGHTLGLNHNMRSSHSVSYESLSSGRNPPVNSVMDYPATNIARPGERQGLFAMNRPGAYDDWAIEFGYSPDEGKRNRILARSTEPALAFGNDADDLRSPGVHIDPRVMINDLSDDPITWAANHSTLIDDTLTKLPQRMLENGESYQALLNSYFILSAQKASAARVASRWVGGVFNNRAAVGQRGAQQPLVPVPVSEQRRALATVNAIAFAPDAFAAGEELLSRLQIQRRGFSTFGTNVDPKPHGRALAIQSSLLDHLMHANVLARLTDSRRYGGEYPVSTYMAELTRTVFDADRQSAVNTYRQNLQIEYLNRLITIATGGEARPGQGRGAPGSNYDYVSRSAALASIETVKQIANAPAGDAETQAHRIHMKVLIDEFERR